MPQPLVWFAFFSHRLQKEERPRLCLSPFFSYSKEKKSAVALFNLSRERGVVGNEERERNVERTLTA